MREAYPNPTDTGITQALRILLTIHVYRWAQPQTQGTLQSLHYGYYPRSQSLLQELHGLETSLILRLLNGALIEAIRFMKGEPDIVAMYEKMYLQAITLLKSLGDGKLREDAYRSGQFRVPVS